jgi:hypothetical protein
MRNGALRPWFVLLIVLGHRGVVWGQTPSPGSALYFDGTTADYVIRSAFNSLAQFTVEFWMRTTDTSKEGTAFSLAVSGQDNMITIFDYRDFHFLLNGVYVPSSAGTDVRANDGRWHHIAITFDRNNGQFKFYRDGYPAHPTVTNQVGLLIPSGGTVVIGQDQDSLGGGFQSSQAFLGTIDELRVWFIVRSEFDIREDMHRSLPSGTAGLAVYYRFDESAGTSVIDSSGRNQNGTLFGAQRVTSDAPVGLPATANTFAALNIGTTSATLNGSVDPNGLSIQAYFFWGENSGLNRRTSTNIVTGSSVINQQRTLTGLQPSTTYLYQMYAISPLGVAAGTIMSFTTLGPPSATTDPATFVTSESATLNATVNPRNSATTVYFQYGLTTSYGSTTGTNSIGGGTANVQVSVPITGLVFDTNYHYRVVASNSRGTTFGNDRVFRTQIFGDIGAGIPGVRYGGVAWGDYDNDGDLDLLITGSGTTQLWRNDGDGAFVAVTTALPGLSYSSCAWGDFDNDGDLDILLAGADTGGTRISRLYRNDGNGVFVGLNAGLAGVGVGAVAWGDYDNDGAVDLIITGTTNGAISGVICQVYRNNGDSTFSNIGAALPGIMQSSVAWADYDNDGDLDLAIAGLGPNSVRLAQIRRNDGNGVFADINAALPGVSQSSIAWGDYDNDGFLDLLLTGTTNNSVGAGGVTQIWRNDRNGAFSNINAVLPVVSYGAAAWADFDNDGDMDLVLTGYGTNFARIAQLRSNNGNGTFSAMSASLTGLSDSALAWGDYDNDGDLDLALVGETATALVTEIRRNDSFPGNTIPSPPTALTSLSSANVTLSWSPAADAQTAGVGLTYNLRIGRLSGASDILGPQADILNGYRLLPGMGNVQYGTNASPNLSSLAGGTYYWSVQAVDSAFAGGPFAEEQTFQLVGRAFVNTLAPTNLGTDRATLQAIVNPGGRNTTASFEFGTTTNYGSQLGTTNLGNGFSNGMIEADVSGLLPDVIYHYRATALSVAGQVVGADVSFRTPFISVSPAIATVALPPGAATNLSLTLSNHIGSSVSVTNRFASPAPAYAAIFPTNRALAANGTATVDLLLDSSGLDPGLYQSAILLDSGSSHAFTVVPVELRVLAAEAPHITQVSMSSNRVFALRFSGTSGFAHRVLASTNVVAPLGEWVVIGDATQVAPGLFQFTDAAATNYPQRFYRVHVP